MTRPKGDKLLPLVEISSSLLAHYIYRGNVNNVDYIVSHCTHNYMKKTLWALNS